MATSLDTLSVSQLLELAIGAPEHGTVHFAAMRKLLEAVVAHLDVHYLTGEQPWSGQPSGPSLADVAAEIKEIKKQIEVYRPEVSWGVGGMAEAMKGYQMEQDKDYLAVDFREEIDRIKATQIRTTQKIAELASLVKKLEEEIKKLRTDTVKLKQEIKKEISEQLEAMQQEMMDELQKMEEQQEMKNTMLEQLVTETTNQLNGQLAEIGEIAWTVQAEQERVKAECSNCTFDINVRLGELLQRYEKLQEQVDSLESRQMAMGKLERMRSNLGQDTDPMQPKRATVIQMQKDYEKLNFISENLQKDSQEKHKAIEMLFQSLEKLQKEKADEQDMLAAIEVKADRAALGSKVNCSQFEANLERLYERMQDLQSQISDQKQDWNEVQQKLSLVEEEKLDRLELKAFSVQMEEMCKRSIEELENRIKEYDSGAGIRKQLPVPFSCLSCDRMLTMQVPGPYPETLPYLEPLPPIKESRHSQRRPVVHGSVPRVPQSHGDHSSNSFTVRSNQDSLRNKAVLQGLEPLPNKPRVTQLLDCGGHIPRGRNDSAVIRAQDESGPAASRDRRPGTTPQHISWAPGLVQPLQPHQT